MAWHRFTFPQLRHECRLRGIKGHSRRGIRKQEIIDLLVNYDSRVAPQHQEPLLPWDMFYEIGRFLDNASLRSLILTCHSIYRSTRRDYLYRHLLYYLKKRGTFALRKIYESYHRVRVLIESTWYSGHNGAWMLKSFWPPNREMMEACLSGFILDSDITLCCEKGWMTNELWIKALANTPTLYTHSHFPETLKGDEDIQLAVVQKKVSGLFRLFPQPVSHRVCLAAARHNGYAVTSIPAHQLTHDIVMEAAVQNYRVLMLPCVIPFITSAFMDEYRQRKRISS